MSGGWTIRIVVHVLLAAITSGSPLQSDQNLQKRQASETIVTGVGSRDANGNLPMRREIRDLKDNHPDQWNLYLLGLDALQQTDQNDLLSYYGLARIHGRPYKTWGDVPGLPERIGTSGYCPHNNALFLGWHRPYLALFEQEMYNHVQYIAVQAPDNLKQQWKDAANSFRIPYWDWGSGGGNSVPDVFTQVSIQVTQASGSVEMIPNPLYSYRFHPLIPEDFDGKYSFINTTIRWPANEAPNGPSRQGEMLRAFDGQKRNLQDKVDVAFRQPAMNDFAVVLEEAHGWIHGVIGGGYTDASAPGHMWPLEYSAFEPMFMLHHTFVDLLFSMYESAHPNIYFEPTTTGDSSNVWLNPHQPISADTELLPFRKSAGGFWTTRDARSTEPFGYTYFEPQGTAQTDIVAKATIAKKYSSSARSMLTAQAASAGGHRLLNDDRTFTDWTIKTSASASKLPSTFIINFLFTSSDQVAEVGRWVRLMPSVHSDALQTAEMDQPGSQQVTSSVSLTSALLDQVQRGKIESLEEVHVMPFLKGVLSWKGVDGNGNVIPQSRLGGMTLEVVSTMARIPFDDDAAIVYSEDVTTHPEVTAGESMV